jgi:hypothetical protein
MGNVAVVAWFSETTRMYGATALTTLADRECDLGHLANRDVRR